MATRNDLTKLLLNLGYSITETYDHQDDIGERYTKRLGNLQQEYLIYNDVFYCSWIEYYDEDNRGKVSTVDSTYNGIEIKGKALTVDCTYNGIEINDNEFKVVYDKILEPTYIDEILEPTYIDKIYALHG